MAEPVTPPEAPAESPAEDPTAPRPRARRTAATNFQEIGATGLKQSAGFISEEFLPELKGRRGAQFYREMADNSPIIGALVLGYQQVASHLPWQIDEPEDATARDKAATEFIRECFEDANAAWQSTLMQILSMIQYGWAMHEVVYKRRKDGRIGWAKFPTRSQDTLVRWEFGPHGEIMGMIQADPVTGRQIAIPMSKALLFRTSEQKNNPEGRSMLRPAVVPYQYVRRIQEYEAIGVERDLAGLPVAWVPNEWLTSEDDKVKAALNQMISMVRDVRRNEREGLVLPMIYEEDLTGSMTHNKLLDFELLSSAGGKQFDTDKIITRYNQQIAMSLLGDFVTMGHDGVGSYALGAVKMDLWVMVVDSLCKAVADEFNRNAISKLLELNGMEVDNPPILTYGQVENIDLTALNTYVTGLANAGLLTPDAGTEAWLREQGGMPPLDIDVEPIYEREPINPMTGLPMSETPLNTKVDPESGSVVTDDEAESKAKDDAKEKVKDDDKSGR